MDTTVNSIENIGHEMAAKMLSALTAGDEPDPEADIDIPVNISTDEQKRYLRQNVDIVSIADRKQLALLVMQENRGLLQTCAEGTVINLDVVPPDLIKSMYKLLYHMIQQRV